jgi:hypothetical protein
MKLIISLIFTLQLLNSFGQQDSCIITKTYYPNGKIHEEGCVINGKRQGLWNSYNEYDNKIRFIWTYKNNVKDGLYKVLGETGIIEAVGTYRKGCLADTLKSYNDKGQLTEINVYKADYQLQMSTCIYTKILIKPEKPDGTMETINGKRFLWQSGRKLPIKD